MFPTVLGKTLHSQRWMELKFYTLFLIAPLGWACNPSSNCLSPIPASTLLKPQRFTEVKEFWPIKKLDKPPNFWQHLKGAYSFLLIEHEPSPSQGEALNSFKSQCIICHLCSLKPFFEVFLS